VVLATSYRAEMFTEAFGNGAEFGLTIDYVYESEPLGTGGGIRNAAGLLRGGPDDPIVVLNGDILSGHDLPAQVDLHRKTDAAVTLHLVPVADPTRYGSVPTDSSGRVTAFLEKMKNPPTNQINAGCYVFRRSVIDTIPAGQVVSVEHVTFPGLIESGVVIMGYAEDAYWLDVGTPEAFIKGSCDVVLGRLPSAALHGQHGEFRVLGNATVAQDARLSGGTTVGYGATVEPGAVVAGSVIFDGAAVGAGAIVSGSIVGKGAVIAGGATLDGVVIGDEAYVGPGNELAKGLRLWPGTRLEPTSVRFSSDA
jgi:mannose-1-phosphate guanylyltransferase